MTDLVNRGPDTSSSRESVEYVGDETAAPELPGGSPVRAEREGLPRGYRMRADRHYVEQLASRAAGQPVRMLSVQEIDSTGSFPQVDIEPLIHSIRTHGILHPLLVRRTLGRYSVITGRKRLAAALCLRLADVPCLVHDVNDDRVAGLAAADNLVIASRVQVEERSELIAAVQRAVAQHLAIANDAARLMSAGAPMARSVLELVKAHVWRAARLGDAVALMTNSTIRTGHERLVPTIIEEVIDGFSAEARLSGISIQAQFLDGAPPVCLDQTEVLAGVSGAVLAMLPLIESADQPAIVVKVAATESATTVDVNETATSVPVALARRFFDRTANDRPGGWCALAGALAAKSLAERHGGHATFEAESSGGAVLRLLLPRSQVHRLPGTRPAV